MTSEFLLIRSKNDEICKLGECGGSVTSILQGLLEENLVDNVLTVKKGEDIYDGIPVLISDPNEIEETAGSLHCAPTMVADLIPKFADKSKVAVVCKPCDAMAINELEKRNQIDKDQVFAIGLNCGGTLMPEAAQKMFKIIYELDPEDIVKEEIDKGQIIAVLKDGTEKGIKIDDLEEDGWGRRENCQRCEIMIPRNCDIACGNWGSEDGWTFVELITDKGKELVKEAISKGYIESKSTSEKQQELRLKLEKIMTKLMTKFEKKHLDTEYPSVEDWDQYWNRCIQCNGCKDICPICWCNKCELENEYLKNESELPPDPLIFQGVRLSHMAFSCVNCGQCEDVCPMEIPVSRMYKKVQNKYREKTEYKAGFSDELPPLYDPENE